MDRRTCVAWRVGAADGKSRFMIQLGPAAACGHCVWSRQWEVGCGQVNSSPAASQHGCRAPYQNLRVTCCRLRWFQGIIRSSTKKSGTFWDTVQALGENMLSRTCTAAEIGSQHRTVLRATYGNDTSLGMWDQGNN